MSHVRSACECLTCRKERRAIVGMEEILTRVSRERLVKTDRDMLDDVIGYLEELLASIKEGRDGQVRL